MSSGATETALRRPFDYAAPRVDVSRGGERLARGALGRQVDGRAAHGHRAAVGE